MSLSVSHDYTVTGSRIPRTTRLLRNSRLSLSLSLPKVVHGEGRGKKFHVFAIIIAKIRATEWDERRVNRSRIVEIYYFEQNGKGEILTMELLSIIYHSKNRKQVITKIYPL